MTATISGTGASPLAAEFASALRLSGVKPPSPPALNGVAQPGSDTVASLLQNLSQTEITALLNVIDRPESPAGAAHVHGLLRAATAAAAGGDGNRAMGHLAEFAALAPRQAEALGSQSSLRPIRGEVEHLLSQLSATARLDAEARLAEAATLLEPGGARKLVVRGIRAEILISIAGRLIEAGGYANSLRSAELSRMLIDQCRWAPCPVPPGFEAPSRIPGVPEDKTPATGTAILIVLRRALELWRRAPLLFLLLAWFTAGGAGGAVSALLRNCSPQGLPLALAASAFEVWALGLLVLVCFGFYRSIRNLRF
jgi:hypothetical protein